MRILIVKLSSLGDVIHTMAALQDLSEIYPDIEVDWVVEKAFAPIVKCHPFVKRVIEIEQRRWRKHPWQAFMSGDWKHFKKTLQAYSYDKIIDAQGLLKSALVASLARGPRFGLDRRSAREPLASFFYNTQLFVSKDKHAVDRLRYLFASIFQYTHSGAAPHYGLRAPNRATIVSSPDGAKPQVMFFHGTTWENKHWPLDHWICLGKMLAKLGYRIVLTYGNPHEEARAKNIAKEVEHSQILEKMSLPDLMSHIVDMKFCVAVDTGLGHLAAALGVPTLTILGPTSAEKTGAKGNGQYHLSAMSGLKCAPCLKRKCHLEPGSAENAPCMRLVHPSAVMLEIQRHKEFSDVLEGNPSNGAGARDCFGDKSASVDCGS